MCTRSGPPPASDMARRASSSSGRSGGQCRSSSVSPAGQDLAHARPHGSPRRSGWPRRARAACRRASRPQRSMAAACMGLFDDRGNIGTLRRARRQQHAAVGGQRDDRAAVPGLGEAGPDDLGQHRVVSGDRAPPASRGPGRASWPGAGRARPRARPARPARHCCATGRPRAKVTVSSMPTRRWPPAAQRREQHRQRGAADAGGRPGRAGGQRGDRADQRGRVAGHSARHAHHQVAVHVTACRRAELGQQPVQRGDVPEVEQLELGHHAELPASWRTAPS